MDLKISGAYDTELLLRVVALIGFRNPQRVQNREQ
jgi:hypothetical protein